MSIKFKSLILSAIFIANSSCAPNENFIRGLASSGSDDALLTQMDIDINASSWDAALTDYNALTAGSKAKRAIMFKYAQSLAGKCGFNFLEFFTALGSANFGAGGSPLMYWLMNAYKGKTINMLVPGSTPTAAGDVTTGSYCSWSQKIMDDIKTANTSWTTDEQLFITVFNLAKIGMILRFFGDVDGAGLLGNGVVDASFDMCKTASLPDFYAVQLVHSFSLVLSEGPSAISSLASTFTDISSLCSAAPVAGLGLTMCGRTSISTVNATDIKNMRGLALLYKAAAPAVSVGLWGGAPSFGEVVGATDAGSVHWQCTGLAYAAGSLGCCP
jgi:hypothetical protein